jgi:hypothetical protein
VQLDALTFRLCLIGTLAHSGREDSGVPAVPQPSRDSPSGGWRDADRRRRFVDRPAPLSYFF